MTPLLLFAAAALALLMGKPAGAAAATSPAGGGASPPIPPADGSPERAAFLLKNHLVTEHGPVGDKKHPSKQVSLAQKAMGNLKPDGIYGPSTQARAAELGQQIPSRTELLGGPKKKPPAEVLPHKAKPAPETVKKADLPKVQAYQESMRKAQAAHRKKLAPPAPTPSSAPAAHARARDKKGRPIVTPGEALPPPKDTAHTAPPGEPKAGSPERAALLLKRHLVDHHGPVGDKHHPSKPIAAAQKGMHKLAADGVYGPNTQARAKQLGQDIPSRVELFNARERLAAKPEDRP